LLGGKSGMAALVAKPTARIAHGAPKPTAPWWRSELDGVLVAGGQPREIVKPVTQRYCLPLYSLSTYSIAT
jgi:hypothetical protein